MSIEINGALHVSTEPPVTVLTKKYMSYESKIIFRDIPQFNQFAHICSYVLNGHAIGGFRITSVYYLKSQKVQNFYDIRIWHKKKIILKDESTKIVEWPTRLYVRLSEDDLLDLQTYKSKCAPIKKKILFPKRKLHLSRI